MDWLAQAELEAEWNARWDFLAELAAEHREDPEALREEDRYWEMVHEVEHLREPVSPRLCGEIARPIADDEIPF